MVDLDRKFQKLIFDSNQSPTHTDISLVPVLTTQKQLQFLPHILLFYVYVGV